MGNPLCNTYFKTPGRTAVSTTILISTTLFVAWVICGCFFSDNIGKNENKGSSICDPNKMVSGLGNWMQDHAFVSLMLLIVLLSQSLGCAVGSVQGIVGFLRGKAGGEDTVPVVVGVPVVATRDEVDDNAQPLLASPRVN